MGLLRLYWLQILIVTTALIALSVAWTNNLAKQPAPTALGHVEALGFVLTVWGLLLSVAGFGVTWWQLARTQTSSQAVERALSRIKRDYESFDLITEVRTARANAEITQSHITSARWDDALGSYNALRISLAKIAAVRGGLSDESRESTKDLLAAAQDACNSIEKFRVHNTEQLTADVLNTILRNMDTFLISVEYSLKDSIRV